MLAIIGCGNLYRRDDGVGPSVVQALRLRAAWAGMADVRLIDAGTDGMAAMFAAKGCRSLIIIDACRSGAEPGAVYETPGADLESGYAPSLNLHDFRWEHALHAGRLMFREAFPTDVTVLLIEAATVDFGLGLSPAVSVAAEKVIARIEVLVQSRLQTGTALP